MEFTFLKSIFIFLSTFVGETFGTMFGGGGFIIQPALLLAGIPADVAVANDIMCATFSGLAYVFFYRKHEKQLNYTEYKKLILFLTPFLIIGALIGSSLLAYMPEEAIRWIILIVSCFGFLYMAYKIFSHQDIQFTKKQNFIPYWRFIAVFAMLFIGLYDGVLAAGGGIIAILLLSLIFRQDLKTTLVLANFLSVITLSTASIMFLYYGLIDFKLQALMIPASILAGFASARIVSIVPERILRIIYMSLVFLLLIYLFIDML